MLLDSTNAFISLAPYVIPLYTLAVAAAYWLAGRFWDAAPLRPWFLAAAGFTLAFHLLNTADILSGPVQSDLRKAGGPVFSIPLLLLLNCLGLAAALKMLFPGLLNMRLYSARVLETQAEASAPSAPPPHISSILLNIPEPMKQTDTGQDNLPAAYTCGRHSRHGPVPLARSCPRPGVITNRGDSEAPRRGPTRHRGDKIKGLRVTEPGPETPDFPSLPFEAAAQPQNRDRQRVLVSPDRVYQRADVPEYGDTSSMAKAPRKERPEQDRQDGDRKSRFMVRARHSFEKLDLTLKNFKPGADTPFYGSVFFRSNAFRRPVRGRLYTEGAVNFAGFKWDEAGVKDLRADLTLLDKTVRFTGGMNNFRSPAITLKAETPSFRSGDLAYLFNSPIAFTAPRSSWEIGAVFTASKTVELSLLTRPLNIKAEGSFNLSKSTLSYAFSVSAPPFGLDQLKRYAPGLPLEKLAGKTQLRLRLTSKNGKPVVSRLFANTSDAGFKYRGLNASGLDLSALLSENFADNHFTAARGTSSLAAT